LLGNCSSCGNRRQSKGNSSPLSHGFFLP